MRYFYVVKQLYNAVDPKLVREDDTHNFSDLRYWSTDSDMEGKTVKRVEERIAEVMSLLNNDGYSAGR